jgi:hypothetical protein
MILNNNKKENYHYIFEDNVQEPSRTKRLARGRNLIIQEMREENKRRPMQYLIMLDLDDVNTNGFFVDTIDTCFEYDPATWDVLCANQRTYYYDLWALRKPGLIDGDVWKDKEYKPDRSDFPHFKIPYQDGLVSVESAFGGIAVYRIAAIPSTAKYIGNYNPNIPYGKCFFWFMKQFHEKCEHVEFNEEIFESGGRLFINSRFYNL